MNFIEFKFEIKEKISNMERILQRLNNSSNWISMNEAATYSGLSKSTLRRAVQVGSLKCSRKSGKLLFKRDEIDRWLND